MAIMESSANERLLKIHLNSGVSLKTRWKFSNVGSFGRIVGGQTRISWGVLKPFAISSSSGSSSSAQMTNNSRQCVVALCGMT